MPDLDAVTRSLLEAVSFAARAHHGQHRKDGQEAHWQLVRKQTLHWTAVMFTMYLAFVANVKQMMNADASALMVLALWRWERLRLASRLTLGAFVWSGSYSVLAFLLSLGSKNQHYSSYWWPLCWSRSPFYSLRIIGRTPRIRRSRLYSRRQLRTSPRQD